MPPIHMRAAAAKCVAGGDTGLQIRRPAQALRHDDR